MESISKELRQAVLQAAIQGKLTKQLQEDGNGKDLYQLIKNSHDAIQICNHELNFDSMDFDIPDNWEWAELNEIFKFVDYRGKTPHKTSSGIFLITASNIKSGFMDYTRKEYISNEEYNERLGRGITQKGDILFTTEAPMGNVALCDLEKCSCGQRIITLKLYIENSLLRKLFVYFMISPSFQKQLIDNSTGTTAKGIKGVKLKHLLIPLPPLAEQYRIVARVEELMTKIDELEVIENNLRKLHQAFPNDMKAALLQAAMQGKLTKQLPEDGDAKLLLKEALNSRKSIGKLPQTNVIDDVGLPDNWSYASVGNIFGLLKGNNISGKKLPYLEAKYLRGNIEATIKDKGEFVVKGTRVILVDGENSGEIFIEPEDGYLGSTFKVLYIPECLNKKFACYFLDMNKTLLRQKKKGAAIPHLNKEIFYNLVFPVPPLAEQERVVEKLDRLLPLCDSLQTEL